MIQRKLIFKRKYTRICYDLHVKTIISAGTA